MPGNRGIFAEGGAVRGKSKGSDLGHWKKYASRNNRIPRGKTAENPGVPLSSPGYKAEGAKAKNRGDRVYARGGRTAGVADGVGRLEGAKRARRFR
jgi:hypothetical protein